MRKIPSVFRRVDAERGKDSLVTSEVTPGCEWVIAGEGKPYRKRDGTAVMVDVDGKLWRRYDAKHGKPAPVGGIACQEPDPVTGHWPHWIPVVETDSAASWVLIAHLNTLREEVGARGRLWPGTFEACGPMIGGNAEGLRHHLLFKHDEEQLEEFGRTFESMRKFLANFLMEGVVFHHPDGRMAKVKARDFGFPWPPRKVTS